MFLIYRCYDLEPDIIIGSVLGVYTDFELAKSDLKHKIRCKERIESSILQEYDEPNYYFAKTDIHTKKGYLCYEIRECKLQLNQISKRI